MDLEKQLEKVTRERDAYLARGKELALRVAELENGIDQPHSSRDVDQIYAAFIALQGDLPAIKKNSKGYGYNYATLDTILSAIRPLLKKHGLGIYQYDVGPTVFLCSRIIHISGQWFASYYKMPLPKESGDSKRNYMQELGSRETYARRYQVLKVLGLHPEGEDDDGHGPTQRR